MTSSFTLKGFRMISVRALVRSAKYRTLFGKLFRKFIQFLTAFEISLSHHFSANNSIQII